MQELQFGRFTLRPQRRQILVDGQPAKVGARAFDVLLALIENPQTTTSKGALIDRVWPDAAVEENNLEVQVWALRKLLGAQAIMTVPGRGYRFAMEVERESGAHVPAAAAASLALPPGLPQLIGRDADLAALRRDIDVRRLLTISGIGGIGKSLLARHLLEVERDRRQHGACWIDLAALSDPALVLPAVATAIGVPLGGQNMARALGNAAAPLRLMMVIDNAEHLVEEVAAVVQRLLDAAPELTIVVTSQVPLGLPVERVARLEPLATPDDVPSATQALGYGAVALFVDRVQAVQRRFELTAAHVAAVCSICRRLDGCALAIELAAARVPLLGVLGLEQSLDERLDLLTKGRRDAPARQNSLRAALEWSHGLLSPEEQCLFRRLSVFAGSFTLELAQQVACDEQLDRRQLLDALDGLAAHCLVAVDVADPPRYRLLESPRALALERLAASVEEPALLARHAGAVSRLILAVTAQAAASGFPPSHVIEVLAPDLGNGRAAMDWALRNDAAMAVGLVTPLTTAFSHARAIEGRRLWPATEALLDPAMPAALRLRWRVGAALFYYSEARNVVACEHGRAAAALARDLCDTPALALALGVLGARDQSLSTQERAAAVEEMLALEWPGMPLLSRINNAQTEFMHAHAKGDFERCERAGRRWLELTRAPGWDYERGVALSNLADLALARGHPQLAAQMGRELELQSRGSRHVRTLAIARANLVTALLACDDIVGAREIAELGWPLAAPWQLQPYWGVSLALLAALENRPRACVSLLGYAGARMTAAGMAVQPNEAQAMKRAESVARAHIADAEFDALRQVGQSWPDERAGAAGLARVDIA